MTKFYMNPRDLDKWFYQNKAIFIGDFIEAVLLDGFIVETKRGYAAFYPHYLNEWSSDYYVEFEPGKGENVKHNWYKYAEKELSALWDETN